MALIRPAPPVPKPIDPIQVQITDEGYKGVTVSSDVTPLANIIQYAEGHVWEVEYFSQLIGGDGEPQPHQLDRGSAYQQYVLIKGLELRVTGPLAPEEDLDSGSMTVVGSATLPVGVIPNKGDVFFADIGQGREAELVITSSRKKTHFKQTVFEIEYEVVDYSDHDVSEIRTDLDSKIVKVVHYVRDHNYFGVNPLMLSEDFNYRVEFQRLYRELVHYFFSDFYSHSYQTILLPDQVQSTYDPFLLNELMGWVESDDHPNIVKVIRPRVTTGMGHIPDTVWTAISHMDISYLRNAVHRTGLLHRSYFRTQPDLGGFNYLGAQYCVYPNEQRTDVDGRYAAACSPAISSQMVAGSSRYTDLTRMTPVDALNGLYYQTPVSDGGPPVTPSLPMIAPVNLSGYYVFSDAFYTGQGPLASDVERLIYQGLQHDTLEKPLLARLASTAMHWDNLERFYYIPALIALLRVAIRDN